MIRIRIACVGRIREDYLLAAQAEYLKRLSRYARVEVVELPDEAAPGSPTPAQRDAVLKKESVRALKAMEGFDQTVALCVEGKELDSPAFSGLLADCDRSGRSVCFIIGGSLGLAEAIKARATARISLSRLTFPHRLARIVLLEQVYRGFKILKGEQYHK